MSTETADFIPFHKPSIGEEEISAVSDVLRSGWLTMGPKTREFEQAFAAYLGCRHAIAVNSCTAALHLALDGAGIQPGDEVLVPTNTFTATAAVVVHSGARPVFADTLPGRFTIDPASAAARVTGRTRALIAVHHGGAPCRMEELQQLAAQHGLTVIEDAAHALPAAYRGQRVGTISPLTAFSFYATKTITTGEGGMLTTADDEIAARAARMRLHGISHDAWKRYTREGSWHYEVLDAGFKYNTTDVQAALGLCQLAKAEQFCQARRRIVARYQELLAEVAEVVLPEADPDVQHAWHLFVIRLNLDRLSVGRNEFIEELRENGIGTSVHFIPLHLQPFYANTYGSKTGDCPNAEHVYERCLSLPVYPGMTEGQVERVAAAVKQIAQRHRKDRVHATAV